MTKNHYTCRSKERKVSCLFYVYPIAAVRSRISKQNGAFSTVARMLHLDFCKLLSRYHTADIHQYINHFIYYIYIIYNCTFRVVEYRDITVHLELWNTEISLYI